MNTHWCSKLQLVTVAVLQTRKKYSCILLYHSCSSNILETHIGLNMDQFVTVTSPKKAELVMKKGASCLPFSLTLLVRDSQRRP